MNEKELYERGMFFFNAKRYKEAVTYFEKAIEINFLNVEYYEVLANIHTYLQKTDTLSCVSVIENYKIALMLDPDRLYLITKIDYWEKNYKIPMYEGFINGSISSDDGHSQTCFTQGGQYLELAKYEQALAAIQRGIDRDLKEAQAQGKPIVYDANHYYCIGAAYAGLKQYVKAKDNFNSALKAKNHPPHSIGIIYYQRGLIHQIEGNSEAAISDLEIAKVHLGVVHQRKYVGALLAMQQEQSKLKQKLQEANKIVEKAKRAYFREDYSRAIERSDDAITLFKETEQAYLYKALSHLKLKNYLDALNNLEQFLSLSSQTEQLKKLRKVIQNVASKLKERQQAHLEYIRELQDTFETLPSEVLNHAKNAVYYQGWLEWKKQQKLLKIISDCLSNNLLVLPEGFSSQDEDEFIKELSKIIQLFLEHKPNGKFSQDMLHIHVKIKERNILKNQELALKIDGAIQSVITSIKKRIGKHPGKNDVLANYYKALNEALTELDYALLSEGTQKKEAPPLITPKKSDEPKSAELIKIVQKEKSKEEVRDAQSSQSSEILVKKQTSQKKTATTNEEQEIKKNPTKQDEQAELIENLRQLEKASKTNTISSSDLNKQYKELENTALLLQSAEFYISRAEFYSSSAIQADNNLRKEALCRNALRDYHHALTIDPFLEEIPEKIAVVGALLKTSKGVAPTFLASPKKQTSKQEEVRREDLTPSELLELEKKGELSERQKLERVKDESNSPRF